MADTARTKDDTKELFDSEEVLDRKVTQLAEWIKESNCFVSFTGAGISTAAGIADFRSGMNTVLPTGPGAWELRAHKAARPKNAKVANVASVLPTFTHMSLVELCQRGHMRCVVSQNTDGLHFRSGLTDKQLFELHGNRYLEQCPKCKARYLRDFKCRQPGLKAKQHETGRTCEAPGCNGRLRDTIINFGENLPEYELDMGFEYAKKADLCLALGSSLTVTPAADIPAEIGRRKRLVIVNLQPTPLDKVAALRINGLCDDVMRRLMDKLGLVPREFELRRRVSVTLAAAGPSERPTAATIALQDASGRAFSFCQQLQVASLLKAPAARADAAATAAAAATPAGSDGTSTGKATTYECANNARPIVHAIPASKRALLGLRLSFAFQGHYQEPPLDLDVQLPSGRRAQAFALAFNPATRRWRTTALDDDDGVDGSRLD